MSRRELSSIMLHWGVTIVVVAVAVGMLAEENSKAAHEEHGRVMSLVMAAADRGGVGSFQLYQDRIDWSPSMYEIFGVELGEDIAGSLWRSRIHPDDLESAVGACEAAIASQAVYESHYRVKAHNGQYRAIKKVATCRNGDVFGVVFPGPYIPEGEPFYQINKYWDAAGQPAQIEGAP